MLRVNDLAQSIRFYTEFFGLKVLRQREYPEGQFSLAFLGTHEEASSTVLELTYNWDNQIYVHGSRFGHLAFEVDDISSFCSKLDAAAIEIVRVPGPMRYDAQELIAFIRDPDGYTIELIQSHRKSETTTSLGVER